MVDGSLATNGGINLGEQCGRHLNERNATLIACSSEADNVPYHTATQGNQSGITTMVGFSKADMIRSKVARVL